MPAQLNQNTPARAFAPEEVELLTKQAGELEAFAIRQHNAQVGAKIIDRQVIGDAEAALRVVHAEERARLKMQQTTVLAQLGEAHEAARRGMLARHTAALTALADKRE